MVANRKFLVVFSAKRRPRALGEVHQGAVDDVDAQAPVPGPQVRNAMLRSGRAADPVGSSLFDRAIALISSRRDAARPFFLLAHICAT